MIKMAFTVRACIAGLMVVAVPVLAETRAGHYTPEDLLKQSTLVVKGVVLAVETMEEYKVSFPVKASVVAVLKGKWEEKEITFKHKNPGRNVIYEQEFNKPEKGQKGTFYFQDQNGTLVLIGYVRETDRDREPHR
jgi:hypothetical protein